MKRTLLHGDETMQTKTAYILAKTNKTDQESQRVLVQRDEKGDYWYMHLQSGKWFALPSAWKRRAVSALNAAK